MSARRMATRITEPSLFPQYGHDHGAVARADVALQMDELLPSAQHQPACTDRHRQRRAQQRRLQVRVAVAIVPSLLVAVTATRRNQAVKQLRQVASQARLEL